MNALLKLDGVEWWHVAGWTMLHYLWLGTLVGLAAGVCRLVLRRAPANVRYSAALVCLTLLAAMPVAIAVWVGAKPQAMRVAVEVFGAPSTESTSTAPGSAGGQAGATPEIAAIAMTSAEPNPRQSRGLSGSTAIAASMPPFAVLVLNRCVGYLPWLWIIGTPLTFVLLATGMVGAERLRRVSRVIDDGPILEVCARLAASLRIGRRVAVAVCERIAAPVLVGIVRPMILLPPAALTGWSPEEIEMVLLHELAHVRRWDNLVNLAQRFVEAALFFHPAVWLVSSWVRREREACCDAVVVGRTNRPHAYAEMLVALATQMPRSVLFHPSAASAMAAGRMRGRIRRILKLEDDPMLISGKSLGVVMSGLLLAATLVALNLPSRGHAEESATEVTEKNSVDQGRDDLSELEQVKSLFAANEQNPLLTRSYPVPSSARKKLSDGLEGLRLDRFGPQLRFESRWNDDRGAFEITAPKDAHEAFFSKFIPYLIAAESKRPAAAVGNVDELSADRLTKESADSRTAAEALDGRIPLRVERTGTRRLGIGGNLPVDVTEQEGQRIVSELLKNPAVQTASINRTPDGMQSLFTSIKEPAGKKAFLSWNTDTEGRLTCDLKFIEFSSSTIPSPSPGDLKFAQVSFVQGATSFKDGDRITIREIRGTAETFKPGNIYWIKGTYRLASHDRATLLADTTAMVAANGTSPSLSVQSTHVDRGEGTFTLFLPMSYRGWPHVSFYPADGGECFGGNYFGTGDSVLKQWWGSKEAVDSKAISVAENPGAQQSDEDERKVSIAISDNETATAESQPGRLRLQIRRTENKSGTFPSLEDQKLADLAWKRLGLELEPVDKADLRRVQALGFAGGVKVASKYWPDGQVLANDLLVGLHVWPTTSLKDVAEVLNRDDLSDLDPLKFYVIRSVPKDRVGYGESEMVDKVVTGRISVIVEKSSASTLRMSGQETTAHNGPKDAYEPTPIPPLSENEKSQLRKRGPLSIQFYYAPNSEPCRRAEERIAQYQAAFPDLVQIERINVESQPALAAGKSVTVVPTLILLQGKDKIAQISGTFTVPELEELIAKFARRPMPREQQQPDLRYDGKTLDEWRSIWQTELSTEKRLEVVKALAAFGASGKGKDAADVILGVANQLDWRFIDATPAGKLKTACVDAFTSGRTTGGYRIPTAEWLPLVISELESDPRVPSIGQCVLLQMPKGETSAIPPLLVLSEKKDLQGEALAGLKAADPGLDDERVLARFRQALVQSNGTPDQLVQQIGYFLYLDDSELVNGAPVTRLRFVPELESLLFHPILEVRQAARSAIARIRLRDAPILVKELLQIVDDVANADRLEAVRALAAMGERAKSAESKLKQIAHSESDPCRIAAAVAIGNIRSEIRSLNGSERYAELFGESGPKLLNDPEVGQKLNDESHELFPADDGRGFGGGRGGGFF